MYGLISNNFFLYYHVIKSDSSIYVPEFHPCNISAIEKKKKKKV